MLSPLLALLALSASFRSPGLNATTAVLFESFKVEHSVSYATAEEEAFRFRAFEKTLVRIAEMNADPNDPAEYGVTRWADRTETELRAKCGSSKAQKKRTTAAQAPSAHAWDGTCYAGVRPELAHLCNGTLPDAFDWTEHGAVTPIKDQGSCGNCFTFGATGDFESAWFLAGHDLVSLSEQQLTSCDRVGNDAGCGGGYSNLDTDEYVTKNGGIASEADYPLCSGTKAKCPGSSKKEKKNGRCDKAKEAKVSAVIVGGYQVSGGVKHGQCDWCAANPLAVDEEQMKAHLVRGGPMTIAINSKFFDNYKKGVMKPAASKCKGNSPNDLDHQVLIVGYGTDDGQDYWRIKNSWNAKWGEAGFCRVARNANNLCGVATDATHAIAQKL